MISFFLFCLTGRDSTAFSTSNRHLQRMRLLVCWLSFAGTGSHLKVCCFFVVVFFMPYVLWLELRCWAILLPVFNDALFPSCFILIGCLEKWWYSVHLAISHVLKKNIEEDCSLSRHALIGTPTENISACNWRVLCLVCCVFFSMFDG